MVYSNCQRKKMRTSQNQLLWKNDLLKTITSDNYDGINILYILILISDKHILQDTFYRKVDKRFVFGENTEVSELNKTSRTSK